MPKGKGYAGKNLNASRVNGKKSSVRSITVGQKHPIQPAAKFNTPKSFGKLIKK